MNEKIKCPVRMLMLAAVIGSFIGLSGCATTDRVDSMQAQIDTMARDVAAAKADAAAVNAKADTAVNTANSAENLANEANRRSIETEAKIDRMFKKAMYK